MKIGIIGSGIIGRASRRPASLATGGSWRRQPGSRGNVKAVDIAGVGRALAKAASARTGLADRKPFFAATLGAIAASLLLAPGAFAQSGQQAPAVSGASSANDRLTPLGPEGTALARRVGVWDVTFTEWEKPGAAAVTTGGLVAEREMIGPMLQERLHPVAGGSDPAWTRVDDLTFNRVTSRWDYMSMDSRAAVGLMPAWSLDRDPASRIFVSFMPFALAGDGASVSGQFLRMEQVITETDADHETKDQYFLPADGNGTRWLAKRYSYVRRNR